MVLLLYHYPRCSTSRKGKKWLLDHGLTFNEIDLSKEPPSKEALRTYWEKSGLSLTRFFNTSGQLYRSMGLKDKLSTMSDEEKLTLLAENGMLIKRPLITDGEKVTVGFDEETFARTWGR
ncbi:MAG: Arsenate reductase [Candidatus Carbobacillus altaicus]|uniref:Arsenate reductase n=1 Tax=Candidatus Carbonibacillus altaicus TaxID=2163959 RepID=A0A2R6Y4N9_9BACL|nr:MAG: Arsenate reductase [Candidatus Carbobacillus altaicus]